MTGHDSPPSLPTPSPRRLLALSATALAIAAVILFVAVLPAEYGVDPLGTGRALGLMRPGTVVNDGSGQNHGGDLLVPRPVGPADYYARPFSTDSASFEIGPYDYVEYKYRLEQSARMTFAWRATAEVLHDFHAEPDGADDHTEVSFDKRPLREGFGTHTAPMPGMHGWMWENPGGAPITVTLTTAGFYSSAMEFRPNRRRIPHTIRRALELNP